MRSWFSFNRSILFFSTLMVLLLFWLSISFLMQAFTARQDAQFLARYLQLDAVIRDTVTIVAEERAASHGLIDLNAEYSAEIALGVPYERTNQSFDYLFGKLESVLANKNFSGQLTYQSEHVHTLLDRLRKNVEVLSIQREAVIDDLNLPLDRRNKRLQLAVFDYYGHLISKLEELRQSFRYQPTRLSREVNTGTMISNAAWNLNLSHHLLSAVFEGYIMSGRTALGTAYERSLSMQRSVDTHWGQLKNINSYNNIDEELHTKAIELNNWFGNTYFPQVKRMTRAIGETSPAPYDHWEWRKLAQTLEKLTVDIFDRADRVSVQRIELEIRRANRNLMIDVLLVLLCMCLMAGALWIVQRIHFQANHDDLTRLCNRRKFRSQSEIILDEAKAKGCNYVLVVLDLDNFKLVNDSLGQVNGDRLLQRIAQRLSDAVGKEAMVARTGGDEFSVLKRYDDAIPAFTTVRKMADAVNARFTIASQSVHISARIGYSLYPRDASNLEELRRAADLAIYNAGIRGAGTIESFNPSIATAFQERQSLKADLVKAIDRNEFELHYQPQVDLQSGLVDGLEALLRWNQPERGNVPPFQFIPVAEDAGLLPRIGRWVIEESARQMAEWRDTSGLQLRMSVNVSVHQFLHGDIVQIVRHALNAHFLDPADFEIEITESVAMAEMDRVLEKLQSLRQLGVRVALDDFGTGYSSLGYLQDLPLDTLKIDRSFITKLDEGDSNQRVLLESIAHIARSLNFHTVAEGVETDAQLQQVEALGIETVQGYYFSKPLPADSVLSTVYEINAMHSRLDKAA